MMWAWNNSAIDVPVIRSKDGEDALDRLYRRGAYTELKASDVPAMVLLDLNLGRTDGRLVLATIKDHASLAITPVIILTTSSNPADVAAGYRNGANSYIVKPLHLQRFRDLIEKMVNYWLEIVYLPTYSEVTNGR